MQIRFTMHWNNFTRSSGNAPLLWERMKSGQPFVSFHSEWHLTVFLTTGTDPSRTRWMASYRLPHHGNRFFAFAQNDALPWVLLYRQAWKWLESQLCRLFNVILNGGKNTLWEGQETERWNGVKNLLKIAISNRTVTQKNYVADENRAICSLKSSSGVW